jgi:hypothetical protein
MNHTGKMPHLGIELSGSVQVMVIRRQSAVARTVREDKVPIGIRLTLPLVDEPVQATTYPVSYILPSPYHGLPAPSLKSSQTHFSARQGLSMQLPYKIEYSHFLWPFALPQEQDRSLRGERLLLG